MALIFAQTPTPIIVEVQSGSSPWLETLIVFGAALIGVLVGGLISYRVNLQTQRKLEERQSAKRRKGRIYAPLRQELLDLLEWRKQPEEERQFETIYTEEMPGPFRPQRGFWFVLWASMGADGRSLSSCSLSVRQAMEAVTKAIRNFNETLSKTEDVVNERSLALYKEYGGPDRFGFHHWATDLIKKRLAFPHFPYEERMDLTTEESQRRGEEMARRLNDDERIGDMRSKMLDVDEELKQSIQLAVDVIEVAMQHIAENYEHERITEK